MKGRDAVVRFLQPTLDSSPACAGMAALPGAVPRMMRPGPGQNYPRTGFPLEGKCAQEAFTKYPEGYGGAHPGGASCESSGALLDPRATREVSADDTSLFLSGFR